jgi:hypothetical protein
VLDDRVCSWLRRPPAAVVLRFADCDGRGSIPGIGALLAASEGGTGCCCNH